MAPLLWPSSQILLKTTRPRPNLLPPHRNWSFSNESGPKIMRRNWYRPATVLQTQVDSKLLSRSFVYPNLSFHGRLVSQFAKKPSKYPQIFLKDNLSHNFKFNCLSAIFSDIPPWLMPALQIVYPANGYFFEIVSRHPQGILCLTHGSKHHKRIHAYRHCNSTYASVYMAGLEVKCITIPTFEFIFIMRALILYRIELANITTHHLSLIHIWRCRRSTLCRSRWSPYH